MVAQIVNGNRVSLFQPSTMGADERVCHPYGLTRTMRCLDVGRAFLRKSTNTLVSNIVKLIALLSHL